MCDGVLRVGVKSLATDHTQNRCREVAGSGFYYLFSWALSKVGVDVGHLVITTWWAFVHSSGRRRHKFSLFIFI